MRLILYSLDLESHWAKTVVTASDAYAFLLEVREVSAVFQNIHAGINSPPSGLTEPLRHPFLDNELLALRVVWALYHPVQFLHWVLVQKLVWVRDFEDCNLDF